MKKLISIILIAAILTLGGITTFAEDAFKITVGTLDEALNVNAGDEIVVPVYLSGNVGVYSYAFKYTFDSDVLELQDDKMKQNGKGDYKCLINDFTINNQGSSVIIVSLAGGSKDVTDNGVITYLFFKVKENAVRGFCDISVEYKEGNVCNYAAKPLYPAKVNGGVYVHSENVGSVPSQSNTQSGNSSQTASTNTNSRPIGYVPPDTVPDTAPDYYSSTVANTQSSKVQSTSSVVQSGTSSVQTQSQADVSVEQSGLSSQWQQNGDVQVEDNGIISRNALIAIIIAGIAIIAAAVVSFIVSNRKQ